MENNCLTSSIRPREVESQQPQKELAAGGGEGVMFLGCFITLHLPEPVHT